VRPSDDAICPLNKVLYGRARGRQSPKAVLGPPTLHGGAT
jgi:hypothetical protein